MDYLRRLRYLRYRQTPNNLQRVKAHATREHPCFYSRLLHYLGEISGNKNLSGRFFHYAIRFLLHGQWGLDETLWLEYRNLLAKLPVAKVGRKTVEAKELKNFLGK